MKRFLVLVALCSTSCLVANASSARISGYISDSKCAATHNSSSGDEACVKQCIKNGQKPVFVDDEKKEVWAIDNPSVVRNDYGRRVTVVAKVDDANKSIHISRVSLVKTAK